MAIVKGELDTSHLMGQPTENRTGFHSIELNADIDSDASPADLEEILRLSELRCPVSDNVGAETPIAIRLASATDEDSRAVAHQRRARPTPRAMNFARIADLYARLSGVAPSPIVDLNRAIAVAFCQGPDAGLALLDTLNLDAPLGSTTCRTPAVPTCRGPPW